MAEDLAKRRRVRGGQRTSVTKTIHQVEAALAGAPDVTRLTALKMALTEKLKTLSDLDEAITGLIENEGELADDIELADDYKQKIYTAIVSIDEAVAPTPTIGPVLGRASTNGAPFPTDATSGVRLPKLTMRPFDGDITKWTSFWDSYKSAIHTNGRLLAVDKFNYLRSLLERTAREAISGLSLTEANYAEAVEILQKRFGSKQKIISKHMDILLNLDPVETTSAKALRHLYDRVEGNIRGLKSLGVDSKTYGSLLSPVLLSKLPDEIRLLVSREITEDDWTLDALLERVELEVVARERAGGGQVRSLEKTTVTGSTLFNPSTPTCCYCQQSHSSNSCKSVLDVEERKRILRRSGWCYVCLRRGHVSRNCRSTTKCYKCKGKHHSSLCLPEPPRDVTSREPPPTDPETSTSPPIAGTKTGLNPRAPTFSSSSLLTMANQSVLLQTALTSIYDPRRPQKTMEVRLILDSGSQHSYLSSRIKERLRLEPEDKCQLAVAAFGSKRGGAQTCDVVRVAAKAHHGPDIELILLTVPYICEPLSVQPISLCQERFDHLSHLELADNSDGSTSMEVDILVGSDYYWRLMTGDIRRGKDGPVALYSRFGWVLSGPVSIARQETSAVNLITTHNLRVDMEPDSLKMLDARLHSFWNLESLGVSLEEDPLLEEFNDKIRFVDGRYEVSLPWRDYHSPLPTNYELASKRLGGLYRRLRQDQFVLREYDRIIQDQLQKGVVQVVEPRDCGGQKLHYLPHHPVVRRDKETTKVRIVYDASARYTGPSLNDCLYPGPKFNQRILDILLRFRVYKIPLTADIEKAFLMISVAERDRDVLRFLWFDNVFLDEPSMIELRFARVVFGVSSSPFLLNATVKSHLERFLATHAETVTSILQSIYVDDVAFGAEDEESAYKLYRESKEILGSGSFNLRKFTSSCPSLQARIDKAEGTETPSQGEGDLDDTFAKSTLGGALSTRKSEQKILGVCWDTPSDCVVFDLSEITEFAAHLEPTKRNVVSMVGCFYDPIGAISPVVVNFKVLIQEICESQVDWDQPLEEPQAEKWHSLVAELKQAQPISIQRSYFNNVNGQVESCCLYGFCDASKKAYAAVIYLVMRTSMRTYVQFVVSKTRVAPIRSQTIPRLELLSALLLARLMSTTMGALSSLLELDSPRYYSDSQVALYWICGHGKQWRLFVQNRVNEILKWTEKESWKHCPGKENPADLPSRGLTPLELSVSALWRRGPIWMSESDDRSAPDLSDMPSECALEVKGTGKMASHNLLNPSPIASVGALMRCQDYSSLSRLFRVTACVVKFARRLIEALRRSGSSEPDLSDSAEAERLWIVEAQSAVTNDKNFSTWKRQFNLFLDSNGIWRCRGRLAEANMPYSSRHPALLSRDHPLIPLIVRNAHERVGHNGVKDTLTEIRSKYWIMRGRSAVRSIIARCILCRRFEGKAFTAPLPPPLPKFRVQESRPFSHTAVDFAGPLHVRTFGVTQSEKMWICLYTCCVTRAVHIDVVPDMSTDTFVRCLKRFCARRGTPLVIVSDNAKTFKAAAKVIQDVITHPDVKRYCSDLSFEWHFNLEKAPWWGGMFERLIKSTKRCLRKMVGRANFNHDELLTAVVEIEAIINARPLSYISSEDQEEPLTPSHLLCGGRLLSLPEHLTYCRSLDDEDFQIAPAEATRRVKHLHNVLNHFWKRWQQEYLLELRECHRYSRGKEPAPVIEVGDIALLYDDSQPRGFWKLVRVVELITGRDGKTRGAVVRVPDKSGRTTTLRRPLQLLYPLELKCRDQYERPREPAKPIDQTADPRDHTAEGRERRAPRPLRRAAADARDRVSAYLLELDDPDED